jgi:hypothetical protein
MPNPARPSFDEVIAETWGDAVSDTVVRRFATAAARDADLAGFTPAQLRGQVVWLDTPAQLQYHDGTTWHPVAQPADILGAWSTWVPTWYGAGANIGNSAYVARYRRIGRDIAGYVHTALGSSCTMATDQLAIALPVPAFNAGSVAVSAGTAAYFNGAPYRYPGSVDIVLSAPDRMRLWASVYISVGQIVNDVPVKTSTPFGWSPAPSDSLSVSFRYEAAT